MNDYLTTYEKIYLDIKKKIINGEYKADFQLPSISQLCEMYSVSNATIRESIRLLKKDDLVYSLPRKGTFIKGKQAEEYEIDFSEANIIKYSIQKIKIVSSAYVSEVEESIKSQYKKITALYLHNKLPVIFEINLVRIDKTQGIKIEKEREWFKYYKQIINNYDVNKKISIKLCSASDEVSNFLFLSKGQSVFEVRIAYYTKNNQLIGLSYKYISGEDINLEIS